MDGILIQLRHLGEAHTLMGFLATAFVGAWHLYRAPFFQSHVPEKYRWEKISQTKQWFITIGASALLGVFTAVTTGKSGWDIFRAVMDAVQDAVLGSIK